MASSSLSPGPGQDLDDRLELDLAQAVAEVDRSLIRLALTWTLRERLQAGTAMARLAARFRRAPPDGR